MSRNVWPLPPNPSVAALAGHRFEAIDCVRGFALLGMIAYHFSFDLNYFGAIHARFDETLFWIVARGAIAGTFIFLSGVSLVLAANAGRLRALARRRAVLAICCVLVSLGSGIMFPRSWIFFGILHFMLVANVLGLAFLRRRRTSLLLGIVVILVGATWAHPLFDQRWLQWVGLSTQRPVTEDFIPIFPWFGVFLIGMFAGGKASGTIPAVANWRPGGGFARFAVIAGRHSLVVYMLHQPLIIGAMYVWFRMIGA